MSTTDFGRLPTDSSAVTTRWTTSSDSVGPIRMLLTIFASLRLTVFLFAVSILLVLAGTLAQLHYDIWHVIDNYFRCWIALIEVKIFFPSSLGITAGKFPFPGGWLIGTFLSLNLFAAHTIRFKVTATSNKLLFGIGAIALGIFLTYLVIVSGLGNTVEGELSPEFCNKLWIGLRFFLGMTALGVAYALVLTYPQARKSRSMWLWWFGAFTCLLLGGLTTYLFVNHDYRLDPSSLRILWQLLKASVAGTVLYIGCHFVFGKRAGIVLLHGGIALLMINELLVGIRAEEAHMRLVEGETLNYAEDDREAELAIIDKSDPKRDSIVTIPEWMLQESLAKEEPYRHPSLPFEVQIVDYLENGRLRFIQPGETSKATEGIGLLKMVESKTSSTGVDQDQVANVPVSYVQLTSSDGEDKTGIFMLSPSLYEQAVTIGDKTYEIALRFRRLHKSYSVTLLDFERNTYVGTNKAKNFESRVRLDDPANNVSREQDIWMNNPLRYAGDTLYQAGYDPVNQMYTDLQVVSNSGWMIPYVACMIVLFGMTGHFVGTLIRFIRRQEREAKLSFSATQLDGTASTSATQLDGTAATSLMERITQPVFYVPCIIVCVFSLYVVSKAKPIKEGPEQMQIHEFGKLPLAYGGRVQPMDSYARNTMQYLSNGKSFDDEEGDEQPAIRWFLDTVSQAEGWRDHRVLRIDNLEVLQILDLKPREGFRYSFQEVGNQAEEFFEQADMAMLAAKKAEKEGKQLDLTQSKVLELRGKLNVVLTLIDVFSPPDIPGGLGGAGIGRWQVAMERVKYLNNVGVRPVPPNFPGEPWQTVMESELMGQYAAMFPDSKVQSNEASKALLRMLLAYRTGDVAEFNKEIEEYIGLVEQRATEEEKFDKQLGGESMLKPAERLMLGRIAFEAYFNHLRPFYLAMVLYVFAFLLVALSWLGYWAVLNRSAHWLLWFIFALHTFALVCRIYISGRPPVTNLYSSAVFIGWAAVLFALLFEKIYRFGVGNLLATLIGFPTLFIAYNLAADGDTFEVLQAVLDTQFWLATHVVTISLGYSTTFLAGTLGMLYIIMVHVLGLLDEKQRKQFVGKIYGILCFATLFSFVGTVLGGLWADDSWGRFWGWDPKENGALIIVLWNALVLHARWGAMVHHLGLAVLAVFGNVVTAWSWFGVNQLGVGLHAYGATDGRTQMLVAYVVVQLAIMGLGCVPSSVFQRDSSPTTTAT